MSKFFLDVVDRLTGQLFQERVYGALFLRYLYGSSRLGAYLLHYLVRYPLFSRLYGFFQKRAWSRRKIIPFIQAYGIDSSEFVLPPSAFSSFNDFFIRQLKPRPLAATDCIIPADGRYLFFQNIDQCLELDVKGKKMDLAVLLEDAALAQKYRNGTLVLARLCPSDYHRYHFPAEGHISSLRLVNGWLYSVNPIALKKNFSILTENRRILNVLHTEYGDILILEVGATCVGSIHHQFQEGSAVAKGEEMGYFSFGGSCLILLFPENMLKLEEDLLSLSALGREVRCLMGQPLGSFQ